MLGENNVVHEVCYLFFEYFFHLARLRKRRYFMTFSFSRVFNSITKTVGQYLSPTVSPTYVTWNFLVESLTKVVRTVLLCMETENVDEELIVTGKWILLVDHFILHFMSLKNVVVGNESAWLLISLMQCKLNPGQDTLCKLITIQLSNSSSYGNITLASMLQLISKVGSISISRSTFVQIKFKCTRNWWLERWKDQIFSWKYGSLGIFYEIFCL